MISKGIFFPHNVSQTELISEYLLLPNGAFAGILAKENGKCLQLA